MTSTWCHSTPAHQKPELSIFDTREANASLFYFCTKWCKNKSLALTVLGIEMLIGIEEFVWLASSPMIALMAYKLLNPHNIVDSCNVLEIARVLN